MIRHRPELPPPDLFPIDPWRIEQRIFDVRYIAQEEAIYTVANGYLGLRGTYDEGRPVAHDETFLNGYYETWPIVYGENAYGFARTGQTMVNVTNSKIIRLYVDDEPFDLSKAHIIRFRRALDMQDGAVDREVIWEMASGKCVSIVSRRLVSFEHRHLAAISYTVTLLNEPAPVVISSEIFTELGGIAGRGEGEEEDDGDPRKARKFKGQVLVPGQHYARDQRVVLSYETRRSRLGMAAGMDHVLDTELPVRSQTRGDERSGQVAFTVDAEPGQPIHLIKFLAYHNAEDGSSGELCNRVGWTLDHAVKYGYPALLHGQRKFLDDFWSRSDVVVEHEEPRIQQCIRFNLFHLLQSSARADETGIPAKGLTGQAYEGHYFWDSEIYVLPFLTYTSPRWARNQLLFRHGILDRARQRAVEVNQKGALYPWRTINGEEASAYYAAGTAQYHINADIIYALRKYVDATGDVEFLQDFGAEMLVETARMWVDLGFYQNNGDKQFHIHGVTGPDEYNAVVDDNLYTNMMARENLLYAAATIDSLQAEQPGKYFKLIRKVDLRPDEVTAWKQAADSMYIPYDADLGIHLQDDDFLRKKTWNLESIPRDRFPLLLFYHPLVIYRHQVIKQADVVLAMFLLGHHFSTDQKRRNFDYYDPMTTGDSSLSACIQSIVACEIGYREQALDYFRYALLMDLADVGGNVRDGIHIASTGGTWMAIVYGFGGLRDHGGVLSFRPRLPEATSRLCFPLTVHGRTLQVDIRTDSVTYRLISGESLLVYHGDEPIHVTRETPVTIRAPATPPEPPHAL